MILVAVLAVAGLAGIAAAFYFSIRTHGSGYKRSSRGRSAGTGRTRSDGHHVSGAAPNEEWRENARQDADFGETGNPGLISGPAPARAGRRTRTEARQAPQEIPTLATPALGAGTMAEATVDDMPAEAWQGSGPDDSARPLGAFGPAAPRPGRRSAARLARASAADDAEDSPAKADRSRRRMGWRKGADIDEEMWPTESFGGVTDDQFWDDLASDKPLATTARTAQQGKPRVTADPPADLRSGRPPGRAQGGAQGGAWGNARRTGHSGAYPDSRPGDRTAIQPVQPVQAAVPPVLGAPAPGATQPVPMAAQPVPGATQPVPMAAQPVPGATQPVPMTQGQGRQYPRTDSQPMRAATQPMRDATQPSQLTQPSETGGRRYPGAGAGATEDPLTSAAFSLRSSGPVDGRSNQPSSGPHDIVSREHYAATISQETQTFSATDAEAATGGYPGGVPAFRQAPSGGNRAIEARPRSDRPQPSGGWYRSSDTEAYAAEPADPYAGTAAYPYPAPPLGAPVPPDEPRRPNVAGSHSHARQHGGIGNHASRPPQNGGPRRPTYDPRDDYRRLAIK